MSKKPPVNQDRQEKQTVAGSSVAGAAKVALTQPTTIPVPPVEAKKAVARSAHQEA